MGLALVGSVCLATPTKSILQGLHIAMLLKSRYRTKHVAHEEHDPRFSQFWKGS